MQLRTVIPASDLRWRGAGRPTAALDTRYDRVQRARLVPARLLRASAWWPRRDAAFDDTWLPIAAQRAARGSSGSPVRMAGREPHARIAQARADRPSRAIHAELLVSRQVHQPYSPSWSLDGWTLFRSILRMSPMFSPTEQPGYDALPRRGSPRHHRRAPDGHAGPARRAARSAARGALSSSWLGSRSITSLGGDREPLSAIAPPALRQLDTIAISSTCCGATIRSTARARATCSTLRGDGDMTGRRGNRWQAGVGLHDDVVALDEVDRCRSRRVRRRPLGHAAARLDPQLPTRARRRVHATCRRAGCRADWC